MGTKIGPLLDRARAIQRELADERRAAYRSAPVPFVPKPAPPGWLHLEEDIAEEYAPLVSRPYEIEDALELAGARRRAARREQYRLSDGLSLKQEKARKEALIELRLLAGCCARCSNKRAPGNKRLCAVHVALEQERIQRRLRAGLCARCPKRRAPHSKRFCTEHLKSEAAYQHGRAERIKATGGDPYVALKRHTKERREAEVEAGRCRNLCGRKIRNAPLKPGPRPPVLCEPCAESTRMRGKRVGGTKQPLRDAAEKAGLCRMLCGRKIRRAKLTRSAKPPVYCDECARKQRDRTASYLARKRAQRKD